MFPPVVAQLVEVVKTGKSGQFSSERLLSLESDSKSRDNESESDGTIESAIASLVKCLSAEDGETRFGALFGLLTALPCSVALKEDTATGIMAHLHLSIQSLPSEVDNQAQLVFLRWKLAVLGGALLFPLVKGPQRHTILGAISQALDSDRGLPLNHFVEPAPDNVFVGMINDLWGTWVAVATRVDPELGVMGCEQLVALTWDEASESRVKQNMVSAYLDGRRVIVGLLEAAQKSRKKKRKSSTRTVAKEESDMDLVTEDDGNNNAPPEDDDEQQQQQHGDESAGKLSQLLARVLSLDGQSAQGTLGIVEDIVKDGGGADLLAIALRGITSLLGTDGSLDWARVVRAIAAKVGPTEGPGLASSLMVNVARAPSLGLALLDAIETSAGDKEEVTPADVVILTCVVSSAPEALRTPCYRAILSMSVYHRGLLASAAKSGLVGGGGGGGLADVGFAALGLHSSVSTNRGLAESLGGIHGRVVKEEGLSCLASVFAEAQETREEIWSGLIGRFSMEGHEGRASASGSALSALVQDDESCRLLARRGPVVISQLMDATGSSCAEEAVKMAVAEGVGFLASHSRVLAEALLVYGEKSVSGPSHGCAEASIWALGALGRNGSREIRDGLRNLLRRAAGRRSNVRKAAFYAIESVLTKTRAAEEEHVQDPGMSLVSTLGSAWAECWPVSRSILPELRIENGEDFTALISALLSLYRARPMAGESEATECLALLDEVVRTREGTQALLSGYGSLDKVRVHAAGEDSKSRARALLPLWGHMMLDRVSRSMGRREDLGATMSMVLFELAGVASGGLTWAGDAERVSNVVGTIPWSDSLKFIGPDGGGPGRIAGLLKIVVCLNRDEDLSPEELAAAAESAWKVLDPASEGGAKDHGFVTGKRKVDERDVAQRLALDVLGQLGQQGVTVTVSDEDYWSPLRSWVLGPTVPDLKNPAKLNDRDRNTLLSMGLALRLVPSDKEQSGVGDVVGVGTIEAMRGLLERSESMESQELIRMWSVRMLQEVRCRDTRNWFGRACVGLALSWWDPGFFVAVKNASNLLPVVEAHWKNGNGGPILESIELWMGKVLRKTTHIDLRAMMVDKVERKMFCEVARLWFNSVVDRVLPLDLSSSTMVTKKAMARLLISAVVLFERVGRGILRDVVLGGSLLKVLEDGVRLLDGVRQWVVAGGVSGMNGLVEEALLTSIGHGVRISRKLKTADGDEFQAALRLVANAMPDHLEVGDDDDPDGAAAKKRRRKGAGKGRVPKSRNTAVAAMLATDAAFSDADLDDDGADMEDFVVMSKNKDYMALMEGGGRGGGVL